MERKLAIVQLRVHEQVAGPASEEVFGRIAERAVRRHEDEGALGPGLPCEVARDRDQVAVALARVEQRLPHGDIVGVVAAEDERSEEHTSELQSLMRNSNA